MYPDLFSIGNFTIHTYGVCLACGAIVGIILISFEAKNQGYNQQLIVDLSFYILLAAIAGSRIFYILLHLSYYAQHPVEIVMVWQGGLVFYGGFIFALATCAIYLKRYHLPFLKTCDILAPGLAVGQIIGRMGCFFAGCCYGKPTHLPWGVTFTHPHSLAKTGIPLHPTQLYSCFKALLIFLALMWFRRYKKADGQVIWLYILLYGVGRLIIEPFRGDERGFFIMKTFTLTQAIAVVSIPLALFMIDYLRRKHPSSTS